MTADLPELTFLKDHSRFVWDRLTNCDRVQEMFPAGYDQSQDAIKRERIHFSIRSDADSHFTTAIAVDAKEDENLTGLASNKIIIKGIKVQSKDLRNWEVWFWKKYTFDDTDLDLDAFAGHVILSTAEARRIGGANQYYWHTDELDIHVDDLDGTYECHVSVVNRGPGAKTAGESGDMIVEIEYEPSA